MFQDSLFASGTPSKKTQRQRLIALASVLIQTLLVAAFIVVPLVWPETLPLISVAPKIALLTRPRPVIKVQPRPVRLTSAEAAGVHPPAAPQTNAARIAGPTTHGPAIVQAAEGPSLYVGSPLAGSTSLADVLRGSNSSTPTIVVAPPRRTEPLVISQGVSKGLLLAPIQPVYPRIAIASRVEGTVIVTATINQQGHIIGLHVTSGPEMLRSAAVNAIQEARYKPYLLNGQPTDVITTISVTFRMGN